MSDRERRRVERLAVQGDPRARRQLQIWEVQEWGPLALIPIEQVEYQSATGDREAQAYLRDRFGLRPSERFYQDEDTGDMEVEIDLRHSAWLSDPEEFRQRAPYTLRMIQRGVIGGEIEVSGNTLTVNSVPGKGDGPSLFRVTFSPWSTGGTHVYVEAFEEYDPSEVTHPSSGGFVVGGDDWSLEGVMGRIDTIEERFLNWDTEPCPGCGGPINEPWHDCTPYLEEHEDEDDSELWYEDE